MRYFCHHEDNKEQNYDKDNLTDCETDVCVFGFVFEITNDHKNEAKEEAK